MNEYAGRLSGSNVTLGIAISRFNSFFTEQLLKGAIDCFVRHGGDESKVHVVWVPGANELPVAVQRMARALKPDAIVALGCVIQGATPHADLIEGQVSRALGQIALAEDVPVINSVIAAQNLDQAVERSGTKAGNKGWDGVLAALEMVSVLNQL